ncbi:DUF5714 domain-containing protein [Carboxydothermus islandicus]|uniref:DUF5714 domain-containing protein n=1 Tax=Carboxydothermus islandicus TaxID=661089 RepID=UPI00096A3424|nr:DUF5714 domain-containing protein [Carboxydothermus islandicus]
MVCALCQRIDWGNIICINGHYICNDCHGQNCLEPIKEFALLTHLEDPRQIASVILSEENLPFLGCENAYVVAAALLGSLKKYRRFKITEATFDEAFHRIQKQAFGGYCGLTGICGVTVAVGAVMSILLKASCPKNRENSLAMQVAARTAWAIAEASGPSCCRQFVFIGIEVGVNFLRDIYEIYLPLNYKVSCSEHLKHPRSCSREKCRYYER